MVFFLHEKELPVYIFGGPVTSIRFVLDYRYCFSGCFWCGHHPEAAVSSEVKIV